MGPTTRRYLSLIMKPSQMLEPKTPRCITLIFEFLF